jgi:CDP-diacylglycerol--glycerol-3-phosphate 3-phosphatidyltransferase
MVMELALSFAFIAFGVLLFVLFLGGRQARLVTTSTSQGAHRGDAIPLVVIDFGYWFLGAVIPLFRTLHLTPNALSLLSLPASLGASIAIAMGCFGIGGPLLLFAFGLDAWDGLLARELGTASNAGEVVDATVDRYNDVILMLGFLYYYRADLVPWLLASAALVGTVVVSYTRAKGESFGVETEIGFMQRAERALWLGVACLIAPATARLLEGPSSHPFYHAVVMALVAVAIGTNITAVRRARLVVASLLRRHDPIARTNSSDSKSRRA